MRHGIRYLEAIAGKPPGSHVLNDRLRYMLIGYARVSKTDGSQSLDLQRDALRAEGIDAVNLYHDFASGGRDDRPGLDSCLRALRKGDVLVAWKLDRLGRNLAHLVNTVQDLSARGVGLRVLAGQGAQIDTTTAAGRLVFGIFAALAEFERELIRERTVAGLKAARARGRKGGRKFALSKAQVRLAQAAMAHRDTSVSELCRELGIRPVTLYRYVGRRSWRTPTCCERSRPLAREMRPARGLRSTRSVSLRKSTSWICPRSFTSGTRKPRSLWTCRNRLSKPSRNI